MILDDNPIIPDEDEADDEQGFGQMTFEKPKKIGSQPRQSLYNSKALINVVKSAVGRRLIQDKTSQNKKDGDVWEADAANGVLSWGKMKYERN